MSKLLPFRKSSPILFAIVLVVVVAALALADWPLDWRSSLWAWLGTQSGEAQETNSTTLRNVGFVVAGVLALGIAIWRGIAADKQAKAAQLQAQTALSQAETAQRGLLNERYQKGSEMLGSDVLAARLGGIYALERLAGEDPEQYHVQIMHVFCAVVRHSYSGRRLGDRSMPIMYTVDYPEPQLDPDRLAILEIVGKRNDAMITLERKARYYLDLTGANLRSVDFSNANLQNINLSNSDLSVAALCNSRLHNSTYTGTNFSGTRFSLVGRDAAHGIEQRLLRLAVASYDNPPWLKGVLDAETGKQLVWDGGPIPSPSYNPFQ